MYRWPIDKGYTIDTDKVKKVIDEIRTSVELTRMEELEKFLESANMTKDEYWTYVMPMYEKKLLIKEYIQGEVINPYLKSRNCSIDEDGVIYFDGKKIDANTYSAIRQEVNERIERKNSEIYEKYIEDNRVTE